MKIGYYFDITSPYQCLAWHVLMRYRTIWDLELVPKPVLLGGVMAQTGNKPPALVPAKARLLPRDLARNSGFFEVPMLPLPSNFFAMAKSMLQVQRMLVALLAHHYHQNPSPDHPALSVYKSCEPLPELSQVRVSFDEICDIITALTRAVHCDARMRVGNNEVVINDEWLLRVLETPLPDLQTRQAVLAAAKAPAAKAGLVEMTKEAVSRNCFGVPFMTVGKEAYFGSDRFEQIAFMNGKVWHGPVPARKSAL